MSASEERESDSETRESLMAHVRADKSKVGAERLPTKTMRALSSRTSRESKTLVGVYDGRS